MSQLELEEGQADSFAAEEEVGDRPTYAWMLALSAFFLLVAIVIKFLEYDEFYSPTT